jgi:(R,R)-butanediol dehydrogenase / meso-butanediol dehydrogenase / diacetyl reductase
MNNKMRSVVWTGVQTVEPMSRSVPEMSENDVLIKVEAAGICGTDLTIWNGKHPRAKAPLIPGHEFSGIVADTRGALPENVAVGSKVLCYPLISCGTCATCRSGKAYVCENLHFYGIDVDGGMAEYVTVAADTVMPVPQQWDNRRAAAMEPLAVAVHAVRRSSIRPGDRVLITGAGIIGNFCGQMARVAGASEVWITDLNDFRLHAAGNLGLLPINIARVDIEKQMREITGGTGFDVTLECSGSNEAPGQATAVTRVLGEIVLVGVPKPPTPMDLRAVNFKELRITGVRVYEKQDFEIALQLTNAGQVEVDALVTHEFDAAQASEAFALMARGGDSIKIQFRF